MSRPGLGVGTFRPAVWVADWAPVSEEGRRGWQLEVRTVRRDVVRARAHGQGTGGDKTTGLRRPKRNPTPRHAVVAAGVLGRRNRLWLFLARGGSEAPEQSHSTNNFEHLEGTRYRLGPDSATDENGFCPG